MFKPGLPMWRVYVDLDEFLDKHPTWNLIVTVSSFYDSQPKGIFNSIVTRDADAEFYNDLVENGGFEPITETILEQTSTKRRKSVYLGYHVILTEDVNVLHVIAVPPNAPAIGTERKLTKNLSGYYATFRVNDTPVSFQKSIQARDKNLAKQAYYSSRPDYKTLDDNLDHLWLHRLAETHKYQKTRIESTLYCLTTEPLLIARILKVGQWPIERRIEVAQNMAIASNDLTREQNRYRQITATLMETIPVQELADSVKLF